MRAILGHLLSISIILKALICKEKISQISVSKRADLIKISLVGIGMMSHSGVAATVFQIFAKEDISDDMFNGIDIVAFPGGIGDADRYYDFFKRRIANAVANYISNGGRYLGICMGAYWAGSHYFDVLEHVDAVQYIKRPNADIKRSYSTIASVDWDGVNHSMFFYDGCALIGDESKFKTIARYKNGDPMAIIQNRIGLIGCHPESEEFWYDKPYLKDHWHNKVHHDLLLKFVDELMKQ
jgi:glutamine amidotransferase-like uncharacterized protein